MKYYRYNTSYFSTNYKDINIRYRKLCTDTVANKLGKYMKFIVNSCAIQIFWKNTDVQLLHLTSYTSGIAKVFPSSSKSNSSRDPI